MSAFVALGQGDNPLVGIWAADESFQTIELLFRSDGAYQYQTKLKDSEWDLGSTDRGWYQVVGNSVTMTSHQYLNKPESNVYQFELDGDTLALASSEWNSRIYELKPGSRDDVLARERAGLNLFRRWKRHILFTGDEEYTFRPGGYYCLVMDHESVDFTEYDRGRFEQTGTRLTFQPYSGTAVPCRIDIFGTTLTLVQTNSFSGWFTSYEEVPGSGLEVRTMASEAAAFLSGPDWQAGVWQFPTEYNPVDLTLRPDGIYMATNTTRTVCRVLYGRYTLADSQIHLVPFVGQERFVLDKATFGMEAHSYTVDYYDSQLQLIDLKPVVQSVTLAREAPGSQATVLTATRQAQAERERDGWCLGIWETQGAAGWMEFTFRPDNCYIAKAGAAGVAKEVERGRYMVAPGKITLAPYAGNGAARGFELDLYEGNLFLIGDTRRLVIVHKIEGSQTGIIEKTRDPAALKGERGSILGLWTGNWPGEYAGLVFRADGQYRWKSCKLVLPNNFAYEDYGLYAVDMAAQTVVLDSRFIDVQTRHLDFYGDTMTLHGGLTNNTPDTYTVNLGSVDAAIAASFAADAAEAQVDAQWLARVPLGPPGPVGTVPFGIGPDPDPGQVFPEPTVFAGYQYYRKLIPRWFHETGVMDSQQWHFFPNGRMLFRITIWEVSGPDYRPQLTDFWGAYTIGPKPTQTDILHCYADNDVTVKLDVGDLVQLTLEDGRRNLFWKKEYFPNASWAMEKTEACQRPGDPDSTLINTGVSLSTTITPDNIGAPAALSISIARPGLGSMTVSGNTELARTLVLERTTRLTPPIGWEPVFSNSVPAGPFSFNVTEVSNDAAFFRVHSQ